MHSSMCNVEAVCEENPIEIRLRLIQIGEHVHHEGLPKSVCVHSCRGIATIDRQK